MPGFFEDMAGDLSPIVRAAMREVNEFFHSDGYESLMRRFQRQYGTLSIDDIAQIQGALGHEDSEETPCRVCKIMATKEVQLDQEE
ncbi:hypothetical protein LCGC14_3138710 [marine sediment metagenome]|uniref:Uncharacterized protein n=1 Tax=marine sediment metagenome TaxID=412755 RepID=A0A0F8VXL1_9ZZZZ